MTTPIPSILSVPDYRPDLQGLRAVAVLLVLIGHADLGVLPGGFVGVDVFFVLSGYLISRLLLAELSASGGLQLARFYARRLRRLLPALLVMILATVLLATSVLSAIEAAAQLESAPYAAAWAANIHFALTEVDYFDELSAYDLFLHTWSLGVEEQFYLIWPLLLLGFWRCSAPRPSRRLFIIALAMLVICGFMASVALTEIEARWAFYPMPARIWQFALGALVGLAVRPEQTGRRHGRDLALAAGLAMVGVAAVSFDPGLRYPGAWALLPSLGTALVLWSRHGDARPSPLAHPWLVWLGDRSYSLYLWHWPLLVVAFAFGLRGETLPILATLILTLLAAMISYRFIELPFWRGRFAAWPTRRVLLLSLLAMSATAATSLHVIRGLPSAAVELGEQWRVDFPPIYGMGCDAWYEHARVEPCIVGPTDAPRTLVYVGDSIGLQWYSAFRQIYPEPEWRLVVLTKSSCAIVDEEFHYDRLGRRYSECSEWRRTLIEGLQQWQPDLVVIGSSIGYPFDARQWIEGSTRVFQRIALTETPVVVLPGTPALGMVGPACIARNLSRDHRLEVGACTAPGKGAEAELVAGYLRAAAARVPGVHVLDLNELVCPGGDCSAVSADGKVVFRDSHHLTDDFVRSRVPEIRAMLDRHGLP